MRGEARSPEILWSENMKARLGDLLINGRIILREILEKYDLRVWSLFT
jgi:hypothetical protein